VAHDSQAQEEAVRVLDLIYRQAHVPAFFNKLASYGIVPTNEREAIYFQRMGDLALEAVGVERQKEAAARFSVAESLAIDLGIADDPAIATAKQAADNFAAQPEIIDAARTLAGYLRG